MKTYVNSYAIRMLGTVIVLFLTLGIVQAGESVCGKDFTVDARVDLSHAGWPSEQQLTILGLTLGKHTLWDVRNKVGEADLIPHAEHKKAHSPEDKICYVSAQKDDETVLIFNANGTLSSFCLEPKRNTSTDRKLCTKTALVSKGLATGNGLKSGLTKDQVKKILGLPVKEEAGTFIYTYKVKEKIPEKELPAIVKRWPGTEKDPYYHFVSFVVIRFDENKLSSFMVTKRGSL